MTNDGSQISHDICGPSRLSRSLATCTSVRPFNNTSRRIEIRRLGD